MIAWLAHEQNGLQVYIISGALFEPLVIITGQTFEFGCDPERLC